MRGGRSVASIRASSNGPVELLALPRERFVDLLHESPLTELTLAKLVQARLQENRIADRRRRWAR